MIKIGITGQAGFLGTHLYNTLGLQSDRYLSIPFEDSFFGHDERLNSFVRDCDIVIHLAAMNRHKHPQVLYETNIRLVQQLVSACEYTNSRPHILFSSSIQEDSTNLYGQSKKKGREMLESWAEKNNANLTSLVIPNVFGPFGTPYYNSVIATFCHQLTHDETPEINIDGELQLIYVSELVSEIIKIIEQSSLKDSNEHKIRRVEIPHTSKAKVSSILDLLQQYKFNYIDRGAIPNLDESFKRNLFNTFLCYINHRKFFPHEVEFHADERGVFAELVKLSSGGQVSFSTTKPGVTRGNHFHTRKAERFAVIKGEAKIEIRRIDQDKKLTFQLNGDKPSFVDMPIWHTHNITNVGDVDLITIFWINEHYDLTDSDTFFEEV